MQSEVDLDAIEQRALSALRAKLGVRARNLPSGLKRAGRRLPNEARRAGDVLSAAISQAQHPKLARMIDAVSIEAAETTLHLHLDKIDPKERRKTMILSFLGTQAFNVLAVAALVIGLMYWRDLL